MNPSPLPIAVLISGGGTTLKNLIEKIQAGELPAGIRLVISSNPAAKGLEFAKAAGIPTLVVERNLFQSAQAFSEAIFQPCRDSGARIVVMGGFLKHVPIPPDFEHRVINIHPALLPAFGGKGMYGLKVHQAVLDAGMQTTGCTIHFVDDHYDHGPVILQRLIPVEPSDTAESLQQRVAAIEREAYPEAIRLLAAGRVAVTPNGVKIS